LLARNLDGDLQFHRVNRQQREEPGRLLHRTDQSALSFGMSASGPDPDIPTRNDTAAIDAATCAPGSTMIMRLEIDSRHTSCAIYDNVLRR
jgi:hypothetical protein